MVLFNAPRWQNIGSGGGGGAPAAAAAEALRGLFLACNVFAVKKVPWSFFPREDPETSLPVLANKLLQNGTQNRTTTTLNTTQQMTKAPFKQQHDLATRKAESARIREKYPDRIPVIVERSAKSDTVPDIDKSKYLVPSDLTVGQFVYVIRKRIKIDSQKAIYIFVNNALPPTAAFLSSVYAEQKDEDGFLYISYSGENVFGMQASETSETSETESDTAGQQQRLYVPVLSELASAAAGAARSITSFFQPSPADWLSEAEEEYGPISLTTPQPMGRVIE